MNKPWLLTSLTIMVIIGIIGYQQGQYSLSRDANTVLSARPKLQSITPTPEPAFDPTDDFIPIFTGFEAISQTLEWLGLDASQVVTATEARLLNIGTLDTWREDMSPDTSPESPAWLVGIRAANLRVMNAIPLMSAEEMAATDPIDGIWVAWDANTGATLGSGTLEAVLPQNWPSLVALTDQSFTIAKATPNFLPTVTPDSSVNP